MKDSNNEPADQVRLEPDLAARLIAGLLSTCEVLGERLEHSDAARPWSATDATDAKEADPEYWRDRLTSAIVEMGELRDELRARTAERDKLRRDLEAARADRDDLDRRYRELADKLVGPRKARRASPPPGATSGTITAIEEIAPDPGLDPLARKAVELVRRVGEGFETITLRELSRQATHAALENESTLLRAIQRAVLRGWLPGDTLREGSSAPRHSTVMLRAAANREASSDDE